MSSAWDGLRNDSDITELPHYAIGKGVAEDAYFTKRDVAKYCVEQFEKVCRKRKVDLSKYYFIEPSAGEGCFYDYIPAPGKRKMGLDINPKDKRFKKADYLSWYPTDVREGKNIVIGNPPFGHRGAMALAFVNRSLLFAEVVAFILPMSFYSNGKGTNMKRVNGATLIHSEHLDRDSFYDPETGDDIPVNTVFQIWMKGKHKSTFADYDVSEYVDIYTCCSAPDRFCGLGKGRVYDCFIASTFYGNDIQLVKSFEEVKYGSGYGIIIKKDKRGVMKALKNADWAGLSSVATNSCRHLRMFHIRQALGKAGYGLQE